MSQRQQVFASFARRVYGHPPGKGASRLERDRWVRALGLKMALPFVPILIAAVIIIDQAWAYTALAVWAALWLGSFTSISLRIRRQR